MTGAIALIAHDAKKPDMVAFAKFHQLSLNGRKLIATESTGRLLERRVGLRIERMLSGVEGGDVQIAARVVQGEVEAVIFLVDPFDRHAHEPDIQSVQRVCQVHDIPLATNVATAHMILAALDYYGEEAAS
jgi:methylglyoxal synthase